MKKVKVTFHEGDTQVLEISDQVYREMMNSDQSNLVFLNEKYFEDKKLSEFKDVNVTY
ncbi:hypothetical protein [Halanaerobacter jeridensis]|uniref:Uncharacterized protein n=1 Tax=Halanaerobacter jeridensis TaxID=706427 RepID=A0A939BPV0_9FIRM|nr:hypothetical protein [Halanaerobacter jeridensis]MBM7557512.1 hypothetical protein [Halanaerobacter jeridensis]